MNISQWINYASRYLTEKCPGAGRIDAEALLCHCMGCDRVALYRGGHLELPPDVAEKYKQVMKRRAAGEPLAYITGHREFMGLDFLVSPAVLIPRPETELLVEKAVEMLKQPGCTAADMDPPVPAVVDVGTGSGAIAVSLAVLAAPVKVYALDISPEAIMTAEKNAEKHGVAGLIEFRQGDLLDPLLDVPGFKADLIAANLPYVTSSEMSRLMVDVRDYEPRRALDGGTDGLDFYRRLVPQAAKVLKPGGCLLMETAPGQARVLCRELAPRWSAQVFKDLAGRERLVVIKAP